MLNVVQPATSPIVSLIVTENGIENENLAKANAALSSLHNLESISLPQENLKPNGYTLNEQEWIDFALEQGEPKFRGKQVFEGIFKQLKPGFDQFSNLSKAFKASLKEAFALDLPKITQKEISKDGTRKYQFTSPDGLAFEAVFIPEVSKAAKRNTLCISSQTGCAVGCGFCYTASLRKNRNLTAGEIIGQVIAVNLDVQKDLGVKSDKNKKIDHIDNIVFMGMGEPLLNYNAVKKSVEIMTHAKGLEFPTKRITISTSGIVPRIYDLGKDLQTQLAISLNATTNATRTKIMPINKKWPLEELIAALKSYPLLPRRKITIEYVLLKDVNDAIEDAARLVKMLQDIPVKINIIPLNEHERTEFKRPSNKTIENFQNHLLKHGMNCVPRTTRGDDISAACGQLGETIA